MAITPQGFTKSQAQAWFDQLDQIEASAGYLALPPAAKTLFAHYRVALLALAKSVVVADPPGQPTAGPGGGR